jgi:hypothetical protein
MDSASPGPGPTPDQGQSPEKMEEFFISQLSQHVSQDTVMVQQQFQKYQSQSMVFSLFGMMNMADPRMWHVNHLFQFKHYLEGYNNIEAFFLSKGLTRFSQYLNAVKADINQALVTYGAAPAVQPQAPQWAAAAIPSGAGVPQQAGSPNYLDQILQIQKGVTDYATKTQLDITQKWKDTFDKTNKLWSDYLKS